MDAEMTIALEFEFRRIGVDQSRLGGLAGPASLTGADVLAWLRRIPTGLGHTDFMKRLELDELVPGLAAAGIPEADRTFAALDLELARDYWREFERVCPRDMQPADWAIGKLPPLGEAVATLRSLPTRAGWEAAYEALERGQGR